MHNAQDALALRYRPKDYIFAQSIFVINKFKSLAVIMKADWKHFCWLFFRHTYDDHFICRRYQTDEVTILPQQNHTAVTMPHICIYNVFKQISCMYERERTKHKQVSVETKESTTHRNNKNKKSHIYMCILLDMREACQLFHFMRIIFFSLLHVGNCCRRMAKRIHCARVRASILAKCIIGGIVAKA